MSDEPETEEPEVKDDEWNVPIGQQIQSEVERLQREMLHMQQGWARLEVSFNRVLDAGTPREAAEVLLQRYLDQYCKVDQPSVLEHVAELAGDSLRKHVTKEYDDNILLGHILERAGVGLSGNNGVVGKITKAAAELAKDEQFIERLVRDELRRHLRLAVEGVTNEQWFNALVAGIVERLQEKLTKQAIENTMEYLEEWKETFGPNGQRQWLDVVFNRAASVSLNKILRETE